MASTKIPKHPVQGVQSWQTWKQTWKVGKHGKCHFLYTIPILGKINLPKKLRNIWQNKICNKAAKAKKTISKLKILQIQ